MKTVLIVLGTITLAVVLVVAGVWLGMSLTQARWGYGMAAPAQASGVGEAFGIGATMGPQMMGTGGFAGSGWSGVQCDAGGAGFGMMGGGAWGNMPCAGAYGAPGDGSTASLEDAEAAIDQYVDRLGYSGLEVTELMEFERNYYAIVAEEDTGTGAMEVLVDRATGAVGPEPGPNMMWNAKYGMTGSGGGMMGMHGPEYSEGMGSSGGMGGYTTGEMSLSPEEAEEVAQRWLDANLPGRTAGEADPFYGYYTLHFLEDGEIEGMLSVHGSTGHVWYHGWHGDFIAMVEGHG